MPEKKLGIGILGCGPISQFGHFESVQKSCNTVLAAVCDVDEGLANHFGKFYDAKTIYLDYDQMLANPDVEAVVIATDGQRPHVKVLHLPRRVYQRVVLGRALGAARHDVARCGHGFLLVVGLIGQEAHTRTHMPHPHPKGGCAVMSGSDYERRSGRKIGQPSLRIRANRLMSSSRASSNSVAE